MSKALGLCVDFAYFNNSLFRMVHAHIHESTKSFALYTRSSYNEIIKKIKESNDPYKQMANLSKRLKEFNIRDYGAITKLQTHSAEPFKMIRKIGPNISEIELPPDLGISPTFEVSDPIEYREPILLPSKPFGPDPILKSDPILDCPLAKTTNRRDRVE